MNAGFYGPPGIAALITLDGVLGGAPEFSADVAGLFSCWGTPASSNLIEIWNSTTDHMDQGTTATFNKQENAATVASLQSAGTHVVTIGNNQDGVWNPAACGLPGHDNTSTQIIGNADRALLLDLGGNEAASRECLVPAQCLDYALECLSSSHSIVYQNQMVLDIIQQFVGSPTVP